MASPLSTPGRLDAWTREDAPTKGWYLRNGFSEIYRYMQVYLRSDDDPNGFATPEGLSLPIVGFMHGLIEHETELRSRFKRTYVCRQYLLPVRTQ